MGGIPFWTVVHPYVETLCRNFCLIFTTKWYLSEFRFSAGGAGKLRKWTASFPRSPSRALLLWLRLQVQHVDIQSVPALFLLPGFQRTFQSISMQTYLYHIGIYSGSIESLMSHNVVRDEPCQMPGVAERKCGSEWENPPQIECQTRPRLGSMINDGFR